MRSFRAYQKRDADEDVVSLPIPWCHGAAARRCILMCVVRLGVRVCLWSPRGPTMSTTFEFASQFPIPAGIWTVPSRWVTRSLSRQNVISVLDRAEPLVPHPFRKFRGSTVNRVWVVYSNKLIIFRKTMLENVNLREVDINSVRKTHIWLSPVSESLPWGGERSGTASVADATGTEIGYVEERQ